MPNLLNARALDVAERARTAINIPGRRIDVLAGVVCIPGRARNDVPVKIEIDDALCAWAAVQLESIGERHGAHRSGHVGGITYTGTLGGEPIAGQGYLEVIDRRDG